MKKKESVNRTTDTGNMADRHRENLYNELTKKQRSEVKNMKMKKAVALAVCSAMIAGSFSIIPVQAGESGEDLYTVKVWGFGNANSEDLEEVSEAISEITRDKIGVNVELYRSMDSEKLNLALTSGESWDLVCTHGMDTVNLANTGRILPLDDLYDEYAPEMKAEVSEGDLECGKVGGSLYALPMNNDNARATGVAMRKDIADELGITADDVKTMDDLHDVLVKVKENYPDVYPLVPTWQNGGMQSILQIDGLYGNLAVIEDAAGDDTTVTSLYETEAYKNFVENMYQWQQEGLIMPDATTNTEPNPIGSIGFADYETFYPGKEAEVKNKAGVDVIVARMTDITAITSIVSGSWSISAASEQPEKAMELYNLMYTDPEIANLFVNGIEGKHYVYTDDTKTMLTLPEGVTEGNTGYSVTDWAWPNECITTPWDSGYKDMYKDLEEFNKSAIASPALGFRFDSSAILNEGTACSNIESEYATALAWGMLDPEEALPKFIEELKSAGMETIQEEAQRQLDEWLASK